MYFITAKFKTPSPGTYTPEKVHPQGERHAPIFSMGTRTRRRKLDHNPAPNRYTLPKMLGSAQPNRVSQQAEKQPRLSVPDSVTCGRLLLKFANSEYGNPEFVDLSPVGITITN